jgi:HPt (histidine-containing phosphotransfer) domain-containing protein
MLARWLPGVASPQSSAATPVDTPAPPHHERWPVDLDQFREVVGPDPAVARGLLVDFVASAGPLLTRLGRAIAEGRQAEAAKLAHAAKGAAGSVMAVKLVGLIVDLEAEIKRNDLTAARTGWSGIASAFEEVSAFVRTL